MYAPLVVILLALVVETKRGNIAWHRRDGLSYETAIVLKGVPDNSDAQERKWLRAHYPDLRHSSWSYTWSRHKAWDIYDLTLADGTRLTIYFDVTDIIQRSPDRTKPKIPAATPAGPSPEPVPEPQRT